MKNKEKLYSSALAVVILFLILVSSTAANAQSVSHAGPFAYITNSLSGSVTVVDTAKNTVTATMNVGGDAFGVAVSPDKKKVYVTSKASNTVSVIDTSKNKVIATVNGFSNPYGIAITPNGANVYVTNGWTNGGISTVSVIDTKKNKVKATVPVGMAPTGVAVTPDGKICICGGHVSDARWRYWRS